MEKINSNKNESIVININIETLNENDDKDIECFADNIKMTCVWDQPQINLHFINQVMNQINIYNDNEFGDCTPSNLSELLSASFPSCDVIDELDDDGSDIITTFVASTPISVLKSNEQTILSHEDVTKEALLNAFKDTSPIVFQSRHRALFTKKRLELS
jgi:hypothetical protein